jgi:salicylate hydroxylase
MPATGRTFYIAGAGISGLTLALALARSGASVVVLERGAAISEFGAGLQISPNARKILNSLGLDDALTGCTLEPAGLDLYPQGHAKPLATMEFGPIMRERFGAPYVVMHRADLVETLYQAARSYPNIEICFNIRAWDLVPDAAGVTVSFEDAEGQSRSGKGFAFIGADGVHSQTRTKFLGGPPTQYGQRVAWRTLVPNDSVSGQVALDKVSVLFGTDHHLVCYPLPHRGQVNLALFVKAEQAGTDLGKTPVLPKSARPDPRLDHLLSSGGQSWTPWPLYTVRTPIWHKGNFGILGDAAHGMVPFQAQGAVMAIEDAAVLAPLLVSEPGAEAAFAKYAQERQPRVTRVADLSATNGKIFHMHWPLSLARDAVIRLQGSRGHLNRLSWLYGHEVQPSPQTHPKLDRAS